MDNAVVYGIYDSINDALKAVSELSDKGYTKNQINLVASEEMIKKFPTETEVGVKPYDEDETNGLWHKVLGSMLIVPFDGQTTTGGLVEPAQGTYVIGDLVTKDLDHEDDKGSTLEHYSDDIAAGKIVVVTDGDYGTTLA